MPSLNARWIALSSLVPSHEGNNAAVFSDVRCSLIE